jgi:hypothetical protein
MASQTIVGILIEGNSWLIRATDRDRYLDLGGVLTEQAPAGKRAAGVDADRSPSWPNASLTVHTRSRGAGPRE